MVPDDVITTREPQHRADDQRPVIGPALAGLLIVTVGYGWCFAVDGLSYIAVIAALRFVRTQDLRKVPIASHAKGQIRAATATCVAAGARRRSHS